MNDAPAIDQVFVTARLRGRRWRATDLEHLMRVYGDADAMRWVGDGSPLTLDEAERWLEVTADNYATRGYGMFALEDRASGEVVGFVGIVHPGGQAEPEVKYAFARERWGRGLATEAVSGVVAYGASQHGITRMIATVAPGNAASQRVLAKAGFVPGEPRQESDGSQTLVFEWSR